MADFEFVVDTREPAKVKDKAIEDYSNTVLEALNSGDFACRVGGVMRAGIERKELHDFVGALKNKRIFAQVGKLRKDYPVVFLILEGDVDALYGFFKKMHLHFNEDAFWGAVVSFSVRANVQVICTPRMVKTIDVAYRICTKMSQDKYKVLKRWQSKNVNTQKDVLTLLPRCTDEIANNLLNKYKSIRNISEQSIYELRKNPGVGPTLAKQLKWLLYDSI